MTNGRLTLVFENEDDTLSVRRFVVREAISKTFDVRIVARSRDDALDFDDFVGKKAGFGLLGGVLTTPRAWSGVVSHMMQLAVEANGLSTYFIRIVPTVALLGYRKTRQIFHHRTLPQIVQDVLKEHGIVPKLALGDIHGEHEYRVQLDETDLAFVSRLLEEEGISYVFEQVPEGKGWTSRLTLRDQPDKAEPRAGGPLRYVDKPDEAARREFVTRVRLGHRVRPGRVTIGDFDFARPDRDLFGRSDPANAPGKKTPHPLEMDHETYRYVPSAFIKERQGKPRVVPEADAAALATIARDARRHDKRQILFESNAFDLAAGTITAFDKHPRSDLGPDHKLLVTEIVVEGEHDGAWTLEAAAAFADGPYRSEQVTPRPVVRGVESATIVGPEGEEIWTDEYGRVRVLFHWDRDHLPDERASCWVRVGQPWAGGAWGSIALPRIGHEVLVDFFDGDPDQPVVVGRVFNGRSRTPYELPGQKTRTAYKSASSPGGKGYNEITFEDAADKELIYVQGQKDLSKLVKADETERTGNVRTGIVGKDRTSVIGKTDTTLVGEKWLASMIEVDDLAIPKLGDPAYDVLSTQVEAKDASISLTTGDATGWLDGPDISMFADGDVLIHAGGQVFVEGGPNVRINCADPSGKAPEADPQVTDRAAKPEGRILDAIKSLFGGEKKKEPAKGPERKELVVPHRTQVGPTCGLAALGMVTDYWHAKDAKNQAPTADALLAKAKEKNYTDDGGMWERDVAKLADHYGYEGQYNRSASIADLKKSVDAGVPPLVTFSVDAAGEPQKATDRGHYAVIKGYFEKDGKEYLVAQHGWGSAKNKVWEAKAFEESWKTLNHGNTPMVTVKPK